MIYSSSGFVEEGKKGIENGSDFSTFVSDEDFVGDLIEVQESYIQMNKGEKIYLSTMDEIVEILDVVHNMDDVVCVVNKEQIVENELTEKSRQHTLIQIDRLIESKKKSEESDKAFYEMIKQSSAEKNFWERLFSRG